VAKVVRVALVIVGTVPTVIVNSRFPVPDVEAPVAITVNVLTPMTVEVPEMVPVDGVRLSPEGNVPLMLHV
jgi:hypothetical protein